MDQSWHEMNLQLHPIRQEYLAICQELELTNDRQRAIWLRAWASTCIADYQETIRQYRAANQRETIVSP